MCQHVAAPTVGHGGLRVPQPQVSRGQLLQQGDLVPPRQSCNGALHNCRVWPSRGEGTHVLQVPRRVAASVGEPLLQVSGQPIDNPGAPALFVLPGEDVGADRPVGKQKFVVDRGDGVALTIGDPRGH